MPIRPVVANKNGGGQFRGPEGYKQSAEYQIELFNEGISPVAVVSAPYGLTDKLIEAEEPFYPGEVSIKDISDNIREISEPVIKELGSVNGHDAERDIEAEIKDLRELLEGRSDSDKYRTHAKGERISGILLKYNIREQGFDAVWFDGYDMIRASPLGEILPGTFFEIIPNALNGHLNPRLYRIPIVCGFGAREIGTDRYIQLGRNSSDYTGAAVAKAMNADRYEIIKEEVVFRADPKFLREAYGGKISEELEKILKLSKLSYSEGVELTSKGAKVVHPMAIDLCEEAGIPIHVKTLGKNSECTVIGKESETSKNNPVAALYVSTIPVISVKDRKMATPEGRGYLSDTSRILANQDVDVINTSDSSTSLSLIVSKDENNGFPIETIMDGMLGEIGRHPSGIIQDEVGYICIVGEGMKDRPGTTSRMLDVLKKKGISIRAISQCDEHADTPAINISISPEYINAAIREFCDAGIFSTEFWENGR